ILDGEIVALDARGVPSFARLQPRFGLTLPREIAAVQEEAPVTVVFFDVLGINGEDCRSLPYDSRRELLETWCRTAASRLSRRSSPAMLPTPCGRAAASAWRASSPSVAPRATRR